MMMGNRAPTEVDAAGSILRHAGENNLSCSFNIRMPRCRCKITNIGAAKLVGVNLWYEIDPLTARTLNPYAAGITGEALVRSNLSAVRICINFGIAPLSTRSLDSILASEATTQAAAVRSEEDEDDGEDVVKPRI